MFNKKCLDIICQEFLKIHLYLRMLEDKFSTKNVEEKSPPKQFRNKPLPKRFVWWKVFVRHYLVEISPSIILVEIELLNTLWSRFLLNFAWVEISLQIFFWCKCLFRICWIFFEIMFGRYILRDTVDGKNPAPIGVPEKFLKLL